MNRLHRARDATFLNRVANDPSVRPHIGGEGVLDFQPLLNQPLVVALQGEHGAFLFQPLDATRFELHTLFLPEGRGLSLLKAAAEAARYMFVETSCTEIVTKVPQSNRAADFMVRKCGFRPMFERSRAWEDGSDIRFFWLSIEDWRAQDKAIGPEGQAFHELIETAKREAGSTLPTHPDDEAHDRAAGLAVLMAKAGQPAKAVWIYNRWAAFAGYERVALVSEEPPIIDIQDAVIGLKNGELEVLECLLAQQ
jgi:hypothetical protein